jgi:uncharacterized protein with PQ loop repeat
MELNLLELTGWVGSFLLAFCGLPQAASSWRNGNSLGVSWGLLIMWGLGEVFTLLYVLPKMETPLIFNYLTNILFIVVISYYKLRPRP